MRKIFVILSMIGVTFLTACNGNNNLSSTKTGDNEILSGASESSGYINDKDDLTDEEEESLKIINDILNDK